MLLWIKVLNLLILFNHVICFALLACLYWTNRLKTSFLRWCRRQSKLALKQIKSWQHFINKLATFFSVVFYQTSLFLHKNEKNDYKASFQDQRRERRMHNRKVWRISHRLNRGCHKRRNFFRTSNPIEKSFVNEKFG